MSKSSRFVLLPFSIGCNSHSSVQLAGDSHADQPPPDHDGHRRHKSKKKKRIPSKSSAGNPKERGGNEDEEERGESSRRWSSAAWCGGNAEKKKRRKKPAVPTTNKSVDAGGRGVKKLVTTVKASLSQLFVYRDEEEDEEIEMEIGFPTDVKHVTHIGLDGNTTMDNSMKDGWDDNLKPPPEIISFPSISLKQFELAMAAQAQAHGQQQHHHLQLQPCE